MALSQQPTPVTSELYNSCPAASKLGSVLGQEPSMALGNQNPLMSHLLMGHLPRRKQRGAFRASPVTGSISPAARNRACSRRAEPTADVRNDPSPSQHPRATGASERSRRALQTPRPGTALPASANAGGSCRWCPLCSASSSSISAAPLPPQPFIVI